MSEMHDVKTRVQRRQMVLEDMLPRAGLWQTYAVPIALGGAAGLGLSGLYQIGEALVAPDAPTPTPEPTSPAAVPVLRSDWGMDPDLRETILRWKADGIGFEIATEDPFIRPDSVIPLAQRSDRRRIPSGELACLIPPEMYSDAVIDFVVLCAREQAKRDRRTVFVPIHDAMAIMNDEFGDSENVRREDYNQWVAQEKVKAHDTAVRQIVFPMMAGRQNLHYWLVVLHVSEVGRPEVQILDSMPPSPEGQNAQLARLFTTMHHFCAPWSQEEWCVRYIPCYRQRDGVSCGPAVCQHMLMLASGVEVAALEQEWMHFGNPRDRVARLLEAEWVRPLPSAAVAEGPVDAAEPAVVAVE